MMTEGEELVLTCQAACKPSAISFAWLFNERRINLQTKGEFSFTHLLIFVFWESNFGLTALFNL